MKKYKTLGDQLVNIPIKDLTVWDKHIKKDTKLDLIDIIASLEKHGQTSPLVVRIRKVKGKDTYEIIDGLRRYFAAVKLKKFDSLYCLVRKMSDRQALLLQAVNTENKKTSGYERALSYRAALYEECIKQKDLAEQLGISQSTLTRRMSFLKLNKDFWDNIKDLNKITDTFVNSISVIINKNNKFKTLPAHELTKRLSDICNEKASVAKLKNLENFIERNEEVTDKSYMKDNDVIYQLKSNTIVFNKKLINQADLVNIIELLDSYLNKKFC